MIDKREPHWDCCSVCPPAQLKVILSILPKTQQEGPRWNSFLIFIFIFEIISVGTSFFKYAYYLRASNQINAYERYYEIRPLSGIFEPNQIFVHEFGMWLIDSLNSLEHEIKSVHKWYLGSNEKNLSFAYK